MLFSGELYVGIDLTRGERSIYYAALDKDLEPVTLAQDDYSSLLAYLGGQQKAVLGVCGPARPNASILVNAESRTQFLIELGKGRPGNMRVAEYFLKQRKLPVYQTPDTVQQAPDWMKTSFKLYQHLQKTGYKEYFVGCQAERQVVEICSEVGYRAWLTGEVLPRNKFYGRMQRQLALYDLGVNLPDPMDFFEEITRFKILQGKLPEKVILSTGLLSALGAAYIAWQTQHQPEEVSLVGIKNEGQIAIPAALDAAGAS